MRQTSHKRIVKGLPTGSFFLTSDRWPRKGIPPACFVTHRLTNPRDPSIPTPTPNCPINRGPAVRHMMCWQIHSYFLQQLSVKTWENPPPKITSPRCPTTTNPASPLFGLFQNLPCCLVESIQVHLLVIWMLFKVQYMKRLWEWDEPSRLHTWTAFYLRGWTQWRSRFT